jgi:hypothetical protein
MPNDGIEKFRFEGYLVPPGKPRARVSVIGGFAEDELTRLDLEIFFLGDRDERARAACLALIGPENVRWIENERMEDGHLELVGMRNFSSTSTSHGHVSMTLDVWALQRGIHMNKEMLDRKFNVVVRLVPSGMIHDRMFGFNANGEISSQHFPDRQPIVFKSYFGELTLMQSFAYRKGNEHGDQTTKRIERLVLAGEITVPRGKSLHEVNETLKDEMHRVRLALSFCFRQPVQLAQINYVDISGGQVAPIYYRHRFHENLTRLEIDEFIHSMNLGGDRLQRLVEKIHQQPRSPDLVRALNFLAVSYASTLENGFFLAFSAMETVVDIAVSTVEPTKLAPTHWKALNTAVKKAIKLTAAVRGFDASDILAKVPELQRPSIRRQVERACGHFNPKVDDIWLGTNYLDGIAEAAALRNGLFHAAQYSDNRALSFALVCVRAFTERLLAKILDWPDENLWVHRDQPLRAMNLSDPRPPKPSPSGDQPPAGGADPSDPNDPAGAGSGNQ